MQKSENINELASALSKAQATLQAAKKDSKNPFFNSKYATLESVWDAARTPLAENNLCVLQTTSVVDNVLCLETTIAHSSGQWICGLLPLFPKAKDSQSIGSAITYARRYALS